MIRRSPPRCALNLTEDILSAWRDHEIPADDAQRLEAHFPSCPACQAVLKADERIARLLRQPAAPRLQAFVWRGVRAHLRQGGSKANSMSRATIMRTATGIGALIVVVAIFAILLPHRPSGTTKPLATHTPAATATVDPLSLWQPASGLIGQGILVVATAISTPTTIYACNATTRQTTVYVSHNSGAAFQVVAQLLPTSRCLLSVDPTDAADVIIVLGRDLGNSKIYRSLDGGKTFLHQNVGTEDNLEFEAIGWSGATVAVSRRLYDYGGPPPAGIMQMAVSEAKQPFTRVDQQGYLGGVPMGTGPMQIIGGAANTLYVALGAATDDPAQSTLVKSADNGQTWTTATLAANGQPLALVAIDGRAMAAITTNTPTQLFVSTDAGTHWLPTPPFPVAQGADLTNLIIAPDGTLAVQSQGATLVANPDPHLYLVSPASSAWKIVPMPTFIYLSAFAVDATGHPTALWAIDDYNRDVVLYHL